jgi:hypothetical protein
MKIYAVITRYYDYVGDNTDLHSLHKTLEEATTEMEKLIEDFTSNINIDEYTISLQNNKFQCYKNYDFEDYTIETVEKELN